MDTQTGLCAGFSVGIKEAIRRYQKELGAFQPVEPEPWEATVKRLRRIGDNVLRDLDNNNPFDI